MTGRKRKGTLLRTRGGRWQGQVTLADGSRKRLPPFPKGTSEATAREKIAEQAEIAATLHPNKPTSEPVPLMDTAMGRWFEKWIDDREARGVVTTHEDTSRYVRRIAPVIGPKHIQNWTREDLRALVLDLDKRVQRDELAWKTAINVWATAKKMCSDAAESKIDALRCRPDDIAAGVRGPDRGDEIGHQWLYPNEFLKFVTCEGVPLRWRRVVALAVYLYPRDAELRALECRDLDIEHMSMRITKSLDWRTGVVKSTKGRRNRSVTIEPNILPLIEALKAEKGDEGAPIADMPSSTGMARGLRGWLLKAGVDRHELHHRTPTTRPIRFHDLRATGITWMAVRGDDPLKIQHRAGHTDFDTTQRYIREAEALREGFGVPFPELPDRLFQTHAAPETHAPIARTVVSIRKDRDDSECSREPSPPGLGRQCLTSAVPPVSSKPCNPIPRCL